MAANNTTGAQRLRKEGGITMGYLTAVVEFTWGFIVELFAGALMEIVLGTMKIGA